MDTSVETALKNTVKCFNQYLREVNPTINYTMADYKNAFIQRLKKYLKSTNQYKFVDYVKSQNIELDIKDGFLSKLEFINKNSWYTEPIIKDLQHYSNLLELKQLTNEIMPYIDSMDNIISNINQFSWKVQRR
jgi:hypothetical protein